MRINEIIKIAFIVTGLITGITARGETPENIAGNDTASLVALPVSQRIDRLLQLTDSLITSAPDKSLEYARQALRLAEEQNDNERKVPALRMIADIYWGKTDLKTALDYANRAKSLALQIDDQKEIAETNLIIGKVYTDLSDYDKSSELNFEALKIFEQLNDKKGIGNALSRIGYIYFDQAKFDKALEYYSKSLAIAKELNDQVGISRGLNNVAAVYANKNQFDHFEKSIKEAIRINKKISHKLWEGINYLNLGIANNDNGNPDTAYFYIQKSISIFSALNNIPKLAMAYIILSKYYSAGGDVEKGLYYARKAFELGQKNKLKNIMYKAAIRLHEIYYQQNDIENAYKYSTIEYRMKDSLQTERSMTRLSQLELMYNLEKEAQKQRYQQQIKNYIYLITAIITVSIFILVIILLVARQRIKTRNTIIAKKQLESELEIKNKELTANVMALMRKNEILSEIADQLMDISDDAAREETKSAIQRIATKLQKSDDNVLWEEFEIRFKQVHHDFYEKLLNRFPNLSPNEQKLCAFLRLNMTTKEISELTGQRISTLEIARSRLRKKLGIANTKENLVTFLSQI